MGTGNGTPNTNRSLAPSIPETKGGGLLDSAGKVLALILGGLGAVVTVVLYIADRPTKPEIRQMIEDRAGGNTFRIERLEKQNDELEARLNRLIEERLRERAEGVR